MSQCESPLEQALLDALRCMEGQVAKLGYVMQQQHPEGPYRLDFAFLATDRKMAVEVDGHAFHERTAEQATRDRQRDRYLVLNGWRVIRFTGTEVHHAAQACARETVVHLQHLASEEASPQLAEAIAKQLIKINKRSIRTKLISYARSSGWVVCEDDADYVQRGDERIRLEDIENRVFDDFMKGRCRPKRIRIPDSRRAIWNARVGRK